MTDRLLVEGPYVFNTTFVSGSALALHIEDVYNVSLLDDLQSRLQQHKYAHRRLWGRTPTERIVEVSRPRDQLYQIDLVRIRKTVIDSGILWPQ